MSSTQTQIDLPEDLVRQIDAAVGARARTEFVVETARAELKRRRLIDFLASDSPAWLEENHPELAGGAGVWVHALRREANRPDDAFAQPQWKVLLDTTVLVDVLRGRPEPRKLLSGLLSRGDLLTTSTINIAEVYAGMRPGEEAQTELFLAGLTIYPVTESIARRAGLLKSESARRGRTLALADMLVAATALEHELMLITDNQRDFPIAGINLFSNETL